MAHTNDITFPARPTSYAETIRFHDSIDDRDVNQQVSGSIVVEIRLVSDMFSDPKTHTDKRRRFVYVNLNGTKFGCSPRFDQNDVRGGFIDRVAAQVWIQKAGPGNDPTHNVPGLGIVDESPKTKNASGRVTSSISFSVSGELGIQGKTPSAGIGAGVTIGQSFSHDVSDFTFYNRSTVSLLYHIFEMTQTGNGHPYSSARDLLDPLQSPFVGARLHSLPALAKSNVPIVSQAIWTNIDDAAIAPEYNNLEVAVALRPSYSFIAASAEFFSIRSSVANNDRPVQYFKFPFDFASADR